MPETLVTTEPHDDDNDSVPHIGFAFHSTEGDEVDITLSILEKPRADRTASLALLTGLVLLAFERSNQVAATITRMFPHGLPTEAAATDIIKFLLKDDLNDVPV